MSKLDEFANAEYIKTNEMKRLLYSNDLSTRYLAATDLVYDMIISIYDVNTRALYAHRFYTFGTNVLADLKRYASTMKKSKSNLEARIIGLQNNQDYYLVIDELSNFLLKNRIKLVEVDLFGGDTRHIAIDAKLGMSFNILMEDRLYRPGELANGLTKERFEKALYYNETPSSLSQ